MFNFVTGISNKWSAFRADTSSQFTIGILEIHNSSHIYFDQRDTTDNKILDSFWLIQTDHGPFLNNVTCSGNGSDVHSSCFCPPPIRYIVYIVVATVGLFVVIFVIVIACCCCRRRRKAKSKAVVYTRVPEPRSNQPRLRISVDVTSEALEYFDGDNEKLLN